MYQKIALAGRSREEWLRIRKTGIGGSDAGAICGVNPYSSPMKIFYEKTQDTIEDSDKESMRQGRDLEDYVAKRFCEATGLKVRRSNFMYRSIEHPWMIADVDRLIVGEDAGLECKTVNLYNAEQWKDEQIPLSYVLQCYHYMAVTGKRVWYIAAVILGQDFVYRKLVWEDAIIHSLVAAEEAFWKNHILPGVMPKPDGSDACGEIINQHFGTARKDSAIALVGFDEKLDRRNQILNQIAALQQEQNRIEQEVKLYMADHELANSEKYRVSWSNVDTSRLDTKRIRKERPDIYRDYSAVSTSRRFQIKAA